MSGGTVTCRQIFPLEAVCSVHRTFYTSARFVAFFCFCEYCYSRWVFSLGRDNHHFPNPKSRFLDTLNFTLLNSIKFRTLILRPKGNHNSDLVFFTRQVFCSSKSPHLFSELFSVCKPFLEIQCIPSFLLTFSNSACPQV